jgi:outer membrane protein OmpA-like peptidoglycan-associated protein
VTRRFALLMTMAALLLSGVSAAGENVADLVGFKLKGIVQGNKQPALQFTPKRGVKSIKAKLWRSDGVERTVATGILAAGATRRLSVQQPKGKFGYKMKLDVVWADGKKSVLRIKFDMTRASGLTMTIDPDDVDLDGRKLVFKLSTDIKRAELRIFDRDDNQVGKVDKTFSASANTALDLEWPQPKGDISYLTLRAWNTKGFWTEMTLKPVSIMIPHADVAFKTGSTRVDKSEEPKLEATRSKLQEAIELHGKDIGVRLYVAGYCDTVGPAAHNRMLSASRARSLAVWFRNKGIRVPIFYQGFGEDVLKVKTPDETPEPANRRAVYLLSTHTPAKSDDIPKQAWKKI